MQTSINTCAAKYNISERNCNDFLYRLFIRVHSARFKFISNNLHTFNLCIIEQ